MARVAALLRQRVQQKVERQARTVTRLGLREVQGAVADGQIGSGRNDIEVVALDRHSIRRLPHGHRRVAGQQVHHHAFVGRIEMLDQDEGHAVAGGQRVHKLPAGIEATRRGAYSDDREVRRPARGAAHWQGRARPIAVGPLWPDVDDFRTSSICSLRAASLPGGRNEYYHDLARAAISGSSIRRGAPPGA